MKQPLRKHKTNERGKKCQVATFYLNRYVETIDALSYWQRNEQASLLQLQEIVCIVLSI